MIEGRQTPLPRWDHATVVVEPPGEGPGYWAGAPKRGRVQRRHLPRLPPPAPRRPGPGLCHRRGRLRRRRRVRAVGRARQGRHGCRVTRAPGARPCASRQWIGSGIGSGIGRRVAAVRELRHPGDAPLAGRRARGVRSFRVRPRAADDGAPRRRGDGDEGSGRRARRRALAPLGLLPLHRGPRRGRPHVHPLRHQRRRPGLDVEGRRPGRPTRILGRVGSEDHVGPGRPSVAGRLLRRAGDLIPELGGADRPGLLVRPRALPGRGRGGRRRSRPTTGVASAT